LRVSGIQPGLLVVVFTLLLWPHPARADAGLAFVEMASLFLFMLGVFVVGLEAWVLKGMLKIGMGQAFGISGLVNVLSYLAGLPVLWAMSNSGPLYVQINQYRNPLLSLVLVAGVFVLSFGIEAPLLKAALKKAWRPVLKACLTANIVSYMVVVPMMGTFSFFPNYGIRPLFAASAEALGEELPKPVEDGQQEVVTTPPPRSAGSSADDP
jgi:hypothetical protein